MREAGSVAVAQQMQGACTADDERRAEVCRQHHMHEPVRERRVENDREPVHGNELADFVERIAGRRLHPAVDREDPERRDERAQRDHQCREEMQPRAHARQAEQHDAEESGFEKEGGQHLVAHQRADDRACLVGEHAPVGAELVAHHDARHDAHAERHCEDLLPVIEQVEEDDAAGEQPEALQHGEVAGQPDRDGREDDVKADRESELQARECQCVDVHCSSTVLSASLKTSSLGSPCPVLSAGHTGSSRA